MRKLGDFLISFFKDPVESSYEHLDPVILALCFAVVSVILLSLAFAHSVFWGMQ
jgi:hypothetical protein